MTKDLLKTPAATLLMSVLSFAVLVSQASEPPQSAGEAAASVGTEPPMVSAKPSAAENVKSDGVAAEVTKESSQESAAPSSVIARDAFSPCEKTLAARVEARWRAMIDKDFAKAYQFTLPTYREANTLEQFKGRFGEMVTWRAAAVKSIQYLGPETVRLSVELDVEYVPSWGGGNQSAMTVVDETWLSREGSWWLSLSR